MINFNLDSHSLLTDKALEQLKDSAYMELSRIENLDVDGFSEADVRAEIIDPILTILGYRKGEDYSVDREKNITFIEGKKRFIDYNLTLWRKNFWIIEAKRPRPDRPRFGYNDLSQVLEYAVHPEIDASIVLLCDGIKIEIFDREQSIDKPLLQIKMGSIVKRFDEIRRIISPLQVWFFYRRRVLRSIDRAFEHEGNQGRVEEFRRLIISHLDGKRGQILENFRRMKKDDHTMYFRQIKEKPLEDIIDIHFFTNDSVAAINTVVNRLISECSQRNTFTVLYRVFPDSPRDTNDFFYMYALELLIRLDEEQIATNWLPNWLKQKHTETSICGAIKILIAHCLNYFYKDTERKIILLASNAFRRIFKIMAVILSDQKKIAEIQHLMTRYSGPEFSWEQILSSSKRNMIFGWEALSMMATAHFVRELSSGNKFLVARAKQRLSEMWEFEVAILTKSTEVQELRKEYDFGEIFPTEASAVVYDSLGHNCLCIIEKYDKWIKYIHEHHETDLINIAKIGSWQARKLIGVDQKEVLDRPNEIVYADRFFFGKTHIYRKLASAYGFGT